MVIRVSRAIIDSLKSQPLALALVIVNVMFLIGGTYILGSIAENLSGQQLRKDQLLASLAKSCLEQRKTEP